MVNVDMESEAAELVMEAIEEVAASYRNAAACTRDAELKASHVRKACLLEGVSRDIDGELLLAMPQRAAS